MTRTRTHEQAAGIRVAAAEDAEAISAVFLASRRAAMPYLPALYTDVEVLHWIKRTILPEGLVWVAVLDEDQPAGFVAVRRGSLDHLYVSPEVHGRGLGSLLLGAAKGSSPLGLRLHVFQRNAQARMFYERHGFSLIELRDGSQNEEREPDAVYEWHP